MKYGEKYVKQHVGGAIGVSDLAWAQLSVYATPVLFERSEWDRSLQPSVEAPYITLLDKSLEGTELFHPEGTHVARKHEHPCKDKLC